MQLMNHHNNLDDNVFFFRLQIGARWLCPHALHCALLLQQRCPSKSCLAQMVLRVLAFNRALQNLNQQNYLYGCGEMAIINNNYIINQKRKSSLLLMHHLPCILPTLVLTLSCSQRNPKSVFLLISSGMISAAY